MYVNMRGGRQGGLWAPKGCKMLESVFVCLQAEICDWSALVRLSALKVMQGKESEYEGMTVSR